MPKITVIIPVFNAGQYIEQCLCSLLNQTFLDAELILIDDGSTDSSAFLCDKYAEKYPQIRAYHLENSGPARARNQGLLQAQGDYIAFVDADDYVAPNYLEVLYNCAVQNCSDIVICNYSIVTAQNIRAASLSFESEYCGATAVKFGLLQRYYGNNHNGLYSLWNKLYRADFLKEHSLAMDEKLIRAEDAWFNFDCLMHAEKVNYVSQALYYYVQHCESIMHQVQPNQYAAWVQTRKRLLEANEVLCFSIDFDSFYQSFLYKVAVYNRDLIKNGSIDESKRILKDNFLHSASNYRQNLPAHLRFLYWLTYHRLIKTALVFYRAWEKLSVCKTAKR